ncbi:L-fuconolactonase [Microbacterium trichothecenolyticum]|uniref:amidohydrolase family protein n=1 Tax=Microbacterium trichothecenolyticum TaxID=69370 RepID=UPI002858EFC2|nr:amidohydrolase family protein [Microbacterium trichothecenolyticum]MDR7183760.1 L-fuconolactonase [Microbacterium trichothecenolyticum]
MRVVDGHLHLWDPEVLTYEWLEGPLLRSFGPDELDVALQDAPEADCGFVFVQAECAPEQSIAEVDWVASLTDRVPVRGIVARPPLEDPGATDEHLAAFAERPLVVGVRRLLQSEPDGFGLRPGFLRGARAVASAGLTFDAGVRWTQLPDLVAFADALPELTIVLDHLGKPEVGSPDAADPADGTPWAESLRDLARRPNVVCKLSGLPAESLGEWTEAQMRPFLDVALDAFGPDRLLFGSDWPVSGPYGRWLDTVSSWLEDRVGERHRKAVFAENAERVYRLG